MSYGPETGKRREGEGIPQSRPTLAAQPSPFLTAAPSRFHRTTWRHDILSPPPILPYHPKRVQSPITVPKSNNTFHLFPYTSAHVFSWLLGFPFTQLYILVGLLAWSAIMRGKVIQASQFRRRHYFGRDFLDVFAALSLRLSFCESPLPPPLPRSFLLPLLLSPFPSLPIPLFSASLMCMFHMPRASNTPFTALISRPQALSL